MPWLNVPPPSTVPPPGTASSSHLGKALLMEGSCLQGCMVVPPQREDPFGASPDLEPRFVPLPGSMASPAPAPHGATCRQMELSPGERGRRASSSGKESAAGWWHGRQIGSVWTKRAKGLARRRARGRGWHPLISGRLPLSTLCRSALSLHRCPMMCELGSHCESLPRDHGSSRPGRVSLGLSCSLSSSSSMPAFQGWWQQGSAPATPVACLARQGRGSEATASVMLPTPHPPRPEQSGRWELPASAGAGRSWAVAELAKPQAYRAVLGQGASDLFLRVTASRGWVLALFVSVVHLWYPGPGAGGGKRGWVRGMTLLPWCPVLPSSAEGTGAEETTEGPQGRLRFSGAKPGDISRTNSM